MSKHLHLQFKFIDRGGREVYEIFNAEDNKRMKEPLGEIRIATVVDQNESGTYCRYARVDLLADRPEEDAEPEQLELDLGDEE